MFSVQSQMFDMIHLLAEQPVRIHFLVVGQPVGYYVATLPAVFLLGCRHRILTSNSCSPKNDTNLLHIPSSDYYCERWEPTAQPLHPNCLHLHLHPLLLASDVPDRLFLHSGLVRPPIHLLTIDCIIVCGRPLTSKCSAQHCLSSLSLACLETSNNINPPNPHKKNQSMKTYPHTNWVNFIHSIGAIDVCVMSIMVSGIYSIAC